MDFFIRKNKIEKYFEKGKPETNWIIEYSTWSDGVKRQNYQDDNEAFNAYIKIMENPNASNVKFFKTETTFYTRKNK